MSVEITKGKYYMSLYEEKELSESGELMDVMWPLSQSHFHVSLKLNFMHFHSYVIFSMKSMKICND